MSQIPYIVNSQWLTAELNTRAEKYLLIDMSKPGIYAQAHLFGAINVDYGRLQESGSAAGLPPSREEIEKLLSEVGLTENRHVIAYDEEGGTRAARFLWVLALAGHNRFSYLDGGIHAWLAQDLPYSSEPCQPIRNTNESYKIAKLKTEPVVGLNDVLERFQDPNTVIWDARSPEEYLGLKVGSRRGGHIPGAVNYNWENTIDRNNDNLLRPLEDIRDELQALGITAEKEVIVHCQTHHRSSFAWLLAKHLGYKNVRGYAGSWAEWGNSEQTPVALPTAAELAAYYSSLDKELAHSEELGLELV